MEILSGDAAEKGLKALSASWKGVLAIATDAPPAPHTQIRCVAIASPEKAVLVQPHTSHGLHACIAHRGVWATYDAKAMHRMMLHAGLQTPEKWACIKITQQLMDAGAHSSPPSAEQIVREHTGSFTNPYENLSALAGHAVALAKTVQQQIHGIKRMALHKTSALEAAAVRPLAMMEHHGMAFDLALWKRLRAQHAQNPKHAHFFSEGFEQAVGQDNRLHATFEQIGAATGRISCRSPNMQAVSKEPWVRACFKVHTPRCLVRADYGACELRILAQLSHDPGLCQALAKGLDVHAQVASAVFNTSVSKEQQPDLRQKAKVVSFGLCYGMGVQGLARTLAVSTVQAEHLLQAYFKAFPKVKQYLEHVSHAALKQGEVRTLSGRRLVFTPELLQDQGHALRVAKNMPIQGTNADMIKTALAKMHQLLQSYEHAYIVHCVHDEIVVECHQSDAHSVQDMLEYAMKTAGEEYIQQVPVHVDSDITHIWD